LTKTISFPADDEPGRQSRPGFDPIERAAGSRNSDSYLVAIIRSENALSAARAVSEDFLFPFRTSSSP
jgi:hypothetical protein